MIFANADGLIILFLWLSPTKLNVDVYKIIQVRLLLNEVLGGAINEIEYVFYQGEIIIQSSRCYLATYRKG